MGDAAERERLVEQARRHLEATGRPRWVMAEIVAITIGVGVAASAAMVHLGIGPMAMSLRYPLAVLVAYGAYLVMLRLWLHRQWTGRMLREDREGLLVPGAAAFGAMGVKEALVPGEEGKKKSWLEGIDGGSGIDLGGLGEGCAPLVVVALMGGLCLLIVSILLVATSPVLLAELLVEGALLGAMTKGIGPQTPAPWTRVALRQTWGAAVFAAIVFGLIGLEIQHIAPRARTFGEAWAQQHRPRR